METTVQKEMCPGWHKPMNIGNKMIMEDSLRSSTINKESNAILFTSCLWPIARKVCRYQRGNQKS